MPIFRPWCVATELRGFGYNDTPSRVHERIAFQRSVFDYVHNRIHRTAGEVRKALFLCEVITPPAPRQLQRPHYSWQKWSKDNHNHKS